MVQFFERTVEQLLWALADFSLGDPHGSTVPWSQVVNRCITDMAVFDFVTEGPEAPLARSNFFDFAVVLLHLFTCCHCWSKLRCVCSSSSSCFFFFFFFFFFFLLRVRNYRFESASRDDASRINIQHFRSASQNSGKDDPGSTS